MRKVYLYITGMLITFAVYNAHAQSEQQYSHFMFTKLGYNPSYAGSEGLLDATALIRTQWVNFDGAPETQYLAAHMPFDPLKGAVGIYIVNDLIGPRRNTEVNLSYAYRKTFNFGTLSGGLSLGLIQNSLNGAILRTPDGEYIFDDINHADPNVPQTKGGAIAPDFTFGISYDYKDIDLGFSINHLSAPQLSFTDNEGNEGFISFARAYHFFAGYNYQLNNNNLTLNPNLLIKHQGSKTQSDINLRVIYRNNAWAGLSLRGANNFSTNKDALVAMIGLRLTDNIILGYAYDITLSQLSSYSAGSHEFVLNYQMDIVTGKPPRIIHCPRFL